MNIKLITDIAVYIPLIFTTFLGVFLSVDILLFIAILATIISTVSMVLILRKDKKISIILKFSLLMYFLWKNILLWK